MAFEPPLRALPARLVDETPPPRDNPSLAKLRAINPHVAAELQSRLRLASAEFTEMLQGGLILTTEPSSPPSTSTAPPPSPPASPPPSAPGGMDSECEKDRHHYLETLRALRLLQGFIRRRRWRKMLQVKTLPIVHGPFGMVAWPIFRGPDLVGVEGPSGHQYRGLSLGFLSVSNPIRHFLIFLVESPWFDRLSLVLVTVNCLLLAEQGPPNSHDGALLRFEQEADLAFTLVFTLELLCRIAARGFSGDEHSYLAGGWNQLDLVIVGSSWLPLLLPQLSSFNGVRAIRALRPLRTIHRLPGLRRQVVTLIESLNYLADVAMLSFFLMVIFGVLGLQLFKGTLTSRCYLPGSSTPIDGPVGTSPEGVCARLDDTDSLQGTCAAGQECRLYGLNPEQGTISFDTIDAAWITIFRCITLEGGQLYTF